MFKPRLLLWLIIILTLFALLIDLPPFHLRFQTGPFKVDRTIGGYGLDINIFGRQITKDFPLKMGLDLSGGIHMVLRADMKNIPAEDRPTALESLRNIIERRVNLYGVSESVVQTSKVGDDHRIVIELPQVTDLAAASSLVGTTAQLDFLELNPQATLSATSSTNPFKSTGLNGRDLKRAQVEFSQKTGQPEIALEFSPEGTKKFAEITQRNVNKPVGIFLDEQPLTTPVVNEPILNGRAVITGNFTTQEAKNLVIQLNAGALPVPVEKLSESVISATLGQIAVQKSLVAGLIGLGLVIIFMLLYYGFWGLLADLALFIYALLVLSIFKTGLFILPPVTLTLAGIAGFILSIGMAVDANILIFERAKEEIRWGKNKNIAVELGFSRAWNSIRDSNISSLLTCAILYQFGTGLIRGFAVTLAIGILVSMFTAIIITRTFLRLSEGKK